MLTLLPLLMTLTAAAPSATPVWRGGAWQALVAGDIVIALEPDLEHVVALELTSGKTRWRTHAQDKPKGLHTLSIVDGRLFFWAGPTLIELALPDGAVKARGEILHNRRECVLQVVGDQGAASCDIGLWLLGLRPISLGALKRATEIHMYDNGLGEPHSTHYVHSARTLLGNASGLSIVAIEDDGDDDPRGGGFFRRQAMLAAVDPKSGEVRWRTRALVHDGLTRAGLSADGNIAWVLSETSRIAGGVQTKNGAAGWSFSSTSEDLPFNGDVLDRSMIVLAGDTLTHLALSNGKRLWTHPAQGAERVVAWGGRDEPLVYPGAKPMKVALANADGAIVIVEVPLGGQLLRDGDGLVLAWPGHLRDYAAGGTVTRETAGPEGGTFTIAPAAVGGYTAGKPVIVHRGDGAPIAGLPEGAQLVGGRGDVIALMTLRTRTDQPGELLLFRVAP